MSKLGDARRESVARGRPYLAGIAGVVALLAVAVSGQYGALLGAALLAVLLVVAREFDRREPDPADDPPTEDPDPDPAEGPPVDGPPANGDHFDARLAASGRALDFGGTLAALVGLVDRRVQVMLAAGADTWAVGEIHGTLGIGRDISAEGQTDEMMLFRVDTDGGDVAGAFAMPSGLFVAGVALEGSRNHGVAFRVGGSVVWVLDEDGPEHRQGQSSEAGEGER